MKKIYRSGTDKKVAGILGGLAESYGIDPVVVRLAFVFIALVTGLLPCLIIYLAGWWIIPEKDAFPSGF